MKYAWEYVLKASKSLHAEGHTTFSPQQVADVAIQMGWTKERHTIQHHVSDQMRADKLDAPHPYLDRLGHKTYRLNEAGRKAAEGL